MLCSVPLSIIIKPRFAACLFRCSSLTHTLYCLLLLNPDDSVNTNFRNSDKYHIQRHDFTYQNNCIFSNTAERSSNDAKIIYHIYCLKSRAIRFEFLSHPLARALQGWSPWPPFFIGMSPRAPNQTPLHPCSRLLISPLHNTSSNVQGLLSCCYEFRGPGSPQSALSLG